MGITWTCDVHVFTAKIVYYYLFVIKINVMGCTSQRETFLYQNILLVL